MAIDDFYMIAAIATIAEKVTNLRSTDLFLTTLQSWDETKKKRWDEREWFCEFVIKKHDGLCSPKKIMQIRLRVD